MTTYEVEYNINTRVGMAMEARDREQAEQFTEEYIDDIYGPDEIVGYEITSIKEVENN